MNTEARVKLQGTLGDPFTVNQGVGQGKILSTFNYKLYINDLLCQLSRSDFGSHVGTDYLGSPTCADDVILLADNIVDLQSQLSVVEDYASRERYIIHPDKSKLITYGTCNPSTTSLNGKDITPDNMLIHLGIERHANVQHPEAFFDARISLARRTSYSLVGTGFHGNNGISPAFTIPIYRTYVIPRLMYGLEAITIKDKHLSQLDRYHRNTLRELQTLPTRTAKCAIHLLAGTPPPPLECLLDQQIVSLLCSVSNHPDSPLARIGIYQLAIKDLKSTSWFIYSARRLARYKIDALGILRQEANPAHLKDTIGDYWASLLREEASLKSSLRYLNTSLCDLRHPHRIWTSTGSNPAEAKKAVQKVKPLSGTYTSNKAYTLQSNKAVFNQFQVVATCPLCKLAAEDRHHFVLECPTLDLIRSKYMPFITQLIPDFTSFNRDQQLSTILDTHADLKCRRTDLEAISRTFLFSLHCARTKHINGS